MSAAHLRQLPSVDKLLTAVGDVRGLPRALVAHLVRQEVAALRAEALGGQEPPDFPDAIRRVQARLESYARSRLQPVINGTGVMIHTNLGRAPLSGPAAAAVQALAAGYSNVELDLESGERGKRARFLETCLAILTGAEAATVVNNCAAGLVLILRHLAAGEKREVVIARGELVEIGGGFRVPEIMETSGAKLREIGATNKVNLTDYRNAIGPETAMLLRVHRSNFYMEGFVGEPDLASLAALAKRHQIPFVHDLGSGALADTEKLAPIEHEVTPQQSLAAGADLVCFSGDKLLGGPQAGIIVGRADLIAGLKRDPFYRALRCDKMVFAALQETAVQYLENMSGEPGGLGATPIPLLRMLALRAADLRPRGEEIVRQVNAAAGPLRAAVGEGTSRCGGGTMPRSSQPSVTVDLHSTECSAVEIARQLRMATPPVMGYISGDRVKLDLRTIFPEQDADVVRALLGNPGAGA